MFPLERVVIVDLIQDITSKPGDIIYKIGILIIKNIHDKGEMRQPHIEISYQFEERSTNGSLGDSIARKEAETMVKIMEDIFSYSETTVYAMYDAYKTTTLLDRFLNKYGYRNFFENMRILDIKTISRDRMAPPYILKNLAEYYNLVDLIKENNSPIDNTKLLLEIIFKIKGEKNDLDKYINLIGFLDGENNYKILPLKRLRILPQKTSYFLKLYEGFDWDGYKFRSILEGEVPIFRVEKDSKYGIAISVDGISFIYDILLPCDYDNIFTIDRPYQEQSVGSKYDTFIYSCYLILVKDGKQGLCRLAYNSKRPNMRNEYSLHLESDIEYDYITVYNQIGYIFHKGKEHRYFGKNKKKLTEKFTSYMIERSNYLIYRREDGTYVLDTVDDKEYKITCDTDEPIFYLGSGFFASCYSTDKVFMITDNGVKEFKDYKYEYNISVGKEQQIFLPESYVVVSGPRGLGVLDPEGKFMLSPEQDKITADLLFTYLKGEHQDEKKRKIEHQWMEFD
jgi:hypothetical protein